MSERTRRESERRGGGASGKHAPARDVVRYELLSAGALLAGEFVQELQFVAFLAARIKSEQTAESGRAGALAAAGVGAPAVGLRHHAALRSRLCGVAHLTEPLKEVEEGGGRRDGLAGVDYEGE